MTVPFPPKRGFGTCSVVVILLLVAMTGPVAAQTARIGSAAPWSPMLNGFNTNRGGSNSAGNAFNEPQAVNVLGGQHLHFLRFAGGDVGNRYNWRTDRVTGTNSGLLGRTQFFDLCAKIGAEAILVANMYGPNNDPANWTAQQMIDEAVAWLRFQNTPPFPYAAQGYNQPVRYWELGNEFYFASAWARTNPNVTNPGEYLPFARAMAAALQAAQNEIDPSVDLKFVIVGKAPSQFRNPAQPDDPTADNWAAAIASEPRWYDGIQYHPYVNNRNWNAASQPFGVNDAEIKWYFSATHNLPQLMNRYITHTLGEQVPLWLTEWGTGVIPVTNDATMNTWMNALADADFLVASADYSRLLVAMMRHQVYTSRFGLFHYSNGTLYRTPWSFITEALHPILGSAKARYALEMEGVATFTGSFQFNGSTPTVLGFQGARYEYESAIPELRAAAFLMPDATRRIVLVNKMDSARTVTLEGGAALGEGTRWQMSAALGARNTGGASDIAPTSEPVALTEAQRTLTLPGYSLTVLTLPALPADQWRLTHFGAVDATAGAPSADPDGDGRPNLLEYALGTDPNVAATQSESRLDVAEARLRLGFRRARAELTYVVEASGDLQEWTAVATNPGSVGEDVTVQDSAPLSADGPRFLRLRVEVP